MCVLLGIVCCVMHDFLAVDCGMEQSVFVVKAGYEPEAFQLLFPFWEKNLRSCNGLMVKWHDSFRN